MKFCRPIQILNSVMTYNLPKSLILQHCQIGNITFTAVVMTDMRENETYIKIYINWLYLIVMYLVPFLSLLVFNFFIYKQVGGFYGMDRNYEYESVEKIVTVQKIF